MKSNYPFVLVHGFIGYGDGSLASKVRPYFGSTSYSAKAFAKEMGIQCVEPSMGPFTGNWDRACEMWAQLVGGTVDYGKVHSEKFKHARYGRTYKKPLIDDWGKLDSAGKIRKINLLGYSFGGPTCRVFIELLANGSEEERQGTPENELSDLFKGGKRNWVHTLTGVACVYNGGPAAELLDINILNTIAEGFFAGLAAIFGNTPIEKIYPFGLDQYGISSHDKCLTCSRFFKKEERRKIAEGYKTFIHHHEDTCLAEMACEYTLNLAKNLETLNNVYYFSYAGCRTRPLGKTKIQIPKKTMFFPFMFSAVFVGLFKGRKTPKIPGESWAPSDGACNVVSALAPLNEPSDFFSETDKCKPGIWYKMPIEDKHHLSFMGIGQTEESYRELFCAIFKRAMDLEGVDA